MNFKTNQSFLYIKCFIVISSIICYSTVSGTTEIITTTLPTTTTTTEKYMEEITIATEKQTTIVGNIENEKPIEEKTTQTATITTSSAPTTTAPTTSAPTTTAPTTSAPRTSVPTTYSVTTPFLNNTSASTKDSDTTTVFPTAIEKVLHENQIQDETSPFWRNFTIVLGTLMLILLIVVGLLMKTYLRYGIGYRDRYRVMCDNEHIRLI